MTVFEQIRRKQAQGQGLHTESVENLKVPRGKIIDREKQENKEPF